MWLGGSGLMARDGVGAALSLGDSGHELAVITENAEPFELRVRFCTAPFAAIGPDDQPLQSEVVGDATVVRFDGKGRVQLLWK